jgi:uncharacterized protein YdaU (DUF1376 family)
MDWYPWYPQKYERKTLHLSTLEHGAYRLLIDAYMRLEAPIPSDKAWICRATGLSPVQWDMVSLTILEFFVESPDKKRLRNPMCDEQLDVQSKFRLGEAVRKADYRARKRAERENTLRPNGRSH